MFKIGEKYLIGTDSLTNNFIKFKKILNIPYWLYKKFKKTILKKSKI